MDSWILWTIIALLLGIAEIMTGSFYLLFAAMGALCGSALAFFGASDTVQVFGAAIVTLIGWAILFKFGPARHQGDSQSNPNLNMDIGATVRLSEITTDRHLRVYYRGTVWNAELADGLASPSLEQDYIISRISGSTLILSPKGH